MRQHSLEQNPKNIHRIFQTKRVYIDRDIEQFHCLFVRILAAQPESMAGSMAGALTLYPMCTGGGVVLIWSLLLVFRISTYSEYDYVFKMKIWILFSLLV